MKIKQVTAEVAIYTGDPAQHQHAMLMPVAVVVAMKADLDPEEDPCQAAIDLADQLSAYSESIAKALRSGREKRQAKKAAENAAKVLEDLEAGKPSQS